MYHRRKWLLGILAVLVAFGIANRVGLIRVFNSDAIAAIPDNTALVLHTQNYQKVLQQLEKQPYAHDLLALSLLEKWKKNLLLIDSLLQTTDDYKHLLRAATIVSGALVVNSQEADWLYAVEDADNIVEIKKMLAALLPQKLENHNYRGYQIYQIQLNNQQRFAFAYSNGVLLISRSTLLVETGIEQLDEPLRSVLEQSDFEQVYAWDMNKESQLKVYFNFETIALLGGVLTNRENDLLEHLKQLSRWTGLDAQFHKEGLSLTGKFYPLPKQNFLKALAKQKAPANTTLLQYLPKNTAAMLYFGWSDFTKVYHASKVETTPTFEEYVLPWLGQEVALVITDPIDDENHFEDDKLVFLKTKDPAATAKLLQAYGEKYGSYRQQNFQNFDINELKVNNIFTPLFGEILTPIVVPYYTIVENYVVFANSRTALESWIRQYMSGQVLTSTMAYGSLTSFAKAPQNIYGWLSTPKAMKFLKYLARPEWEQYLEERFGRFRSLYAIGVSLHGSSNHFDMHLTATYSDAPVEETRTTTSSVAWSFDMNNNAAIAPQLLYDKANNHYYIFVQDSTKRLYLLDNKGDNLWDTPIVLNDFVQSTVFAVDYYANGEMQMAFNTPRSIFVLNQAGTIIKQIDLVASAQTGMLVTNYNNSPNFYVPCRNGGVYGFDKNGQPLNGWQPHKQVGPVYYPMQYLEYEDKKHLLATGRAGNCKSFELDSDANFRGGTLGYNITYWGSDASIGRIAAGNESGKIHVLNTKGKGFVINPLPNMNKKVQFAYADVVGDSRKDYIRLQDTLLAVHYYEKTTSEPDKKGKKSTKDKFTELGIYKLQQPLQQLFALDIVGKPKAYLGGLDTQNNSIYLYNATGELQQGFPLAGTSTFSIVDLFDEHGNTVVVANNNLIYTYKLKL